MSNGVILAIGLAAIAVAVAVAYLVTSGGSDEESADEDPTSETILFDTTVEEAPLTPGSPVQVSVDTDTRDEPRIHPLALSAGDTGTVVVSANQPFNAVVALVDPDGAEVATQGVALGRRGAAVAVNASTTGDHEIVVSGFPPSLTGYTVEYRPDETFVTPAQTAIGDCVNRLEGEEWRNANGFFVVSCDQPHEGQVFEQLPGVTDSGQAAHTRCDTARNNRVLVPGFVAWQAYWGAGLTCVLQGANGGLLTGSLVST